MTKTEYTAVISANQTAIAAIRADLRKLRTIETLSKSFPDLKLVDTNILESSITAKKAEIQKLRAELSKARRIVKRMAEIEDIEAGKTAAPKVKKPTTAKKDRKADTANTDSRTPRPKKDIKQETKKTEQPSPNADGKESPAA